jgi:NAD(P)-dependent dehydrogenase (short-subunit alcohol dehydrogenase family)
MFNLTGKTALVTGGSKGLGKAMARALAEAGADVMITSRHEDELRAALSEILEGNSRKGRYAVADMAQRNEVRRLAQVALQEMGKIDILINNAGTNTPQPIDQIRDEDWDRIMEINLHSCMSLTRALVPGMKERHWGRVIHIASMMALISKEGRDTYCASKAALIGMTRASALELGPFGITVNCIAPGWFLTELPARLLSAEEKENARKGTALGRWGDPKELCGPMLMLATDAGAYVTGTTLIVDGGYICR